ncbi:MAG: glycosyltransferase family 39 protein [Mycobacteriales bacterium]
MSWVPVLLLALGAWMRLRQWDGARSLWLDEALIARSLVSRDYLALVAEPLQGGQAAPVLWLWSTRLSLDLFGDGERQLRLVSLLAGLASLVLTWRLARRLLPDGLVPLAVALTVLSPTLLYFSNEVKPYSLDVAVVLGLILLAVRATQDVRPLAVAAVVAVWASFAAAFVLTGLSVLLVLEALRRDGLARALRTAGLLGGWVVSLGISYVLVLDRLRNSEILSTFWKDTFPDSTADLPTWLLRRAVALTRDPLELAVWPVALGLLAVGAWRIARTAPRAGRLTAAGVLVAVVVAAAGVYPFASRLALWIVPLAGIALAAAVPPRLDRGRSLMLGAAALTLVAAPMAAVSLPQMGSVLQRNELRPVMEQLREDKQPDDLVLVDIPAKAPFDFYTELTGLGRDGVILFATTEEVGGRCNDEAALLTGRFARQRVWVVFAHQLQDTQRLGTRGDMLARIDDVTNRAGAIERFGAKAVLFDPAAPETDAGAEPRNPERCLAVVRTVPSTGS